jgi:hypothetical protein
MPDMLIRQLDMEDVEPFMHQYIVTENGELMVPWYDFIDPENCQDELTCAVINDVEYYSAQDLVQYGIESYRDKLKGMLSIMINFHRDRFDQSQDRAEG